MAFTANGTTKMIFTFEDRDKNTSRLTLYVPGLALVEDVAAWATGAGATLLQALSNALITDISINQNFKQDTYVQPVEASDVERKGTFTFGDGIGTSTFNIPSFINEKVVDNTQIINTADTAVAAFIAAMIDAGLFDAYGLANYRGEQLIELVNAPKKTHRGSSKG